MLPLAVPSYLTTPQWRTAMDQNGETFARVRRVWAARLRLVPCITSHWPTDNFGVPTHVRAAIKQNPRTCSWVHGCAHCGSFYKIWKKRTSVSAHSSLSPCRRRGNQGPPLLQGPKLCASAQRAPPLHPPPRAQAIHPIRRCGPKRPIIIGPAYRLRLGLRLAAGAPVFSLLSPQCRPASPSFCPCPSSLLKEGVWWWGPLLRVMRNCPAAGVAHPSAFAWVQWPLGWLASRGWQALARINANSALVRRAKSYAKSPNFEPPWSCGAPPGA